MANKTLSFAEARELARKIRANENAECLTVDWVTKKAIATERRLVAKDLAAGIPTDPTERAEFYKQFS